MPSGLQDIGGLLETAGRVHGDDPALVDAAAGGIWSYQRALHAVERIAGRFAQLGVGQGDRVLLRCGSCVPAVLSCWAAWHLGAVVVPVDPGWPPYLLDPVLALVAPRLLLHDQADDRRGFQLADADGRPSAGFLDWLEAEPGQGGAVPEAAPGAILFTSGSSGQPKGVVLSRGALARSARLVADTFGWRADDLVLNLGELHAMSGLRNTCLAPAACGGAALLTAPAGRAHPFTLQDTLERHRPTVLGAGPALVRMALRLSGRLRGEAWRIPRMVLCTGGFLAPADAGAFRDWNGRPVINYYGLTETAGICISHTPESAGTGADTLGWPVGASCLILDGAGRECPAGEAGELVVAGPNLMLGYLDQPGLTAEAMRGGVFHTGDRARALADGQIQLIGRIGSAIKTVHTDLLFPEEIEGALAGHPGLADAAAVGLPDIGSGERLVAFLVTRQHEAHPDRFTGAIHQYLRERLGPRRLPSAYRYLGRIPRLSGGKIDRRALQLEATRDEA